MYGERKKGMENRVILVMLPTSSKFVAAFIIDVLIVNEPENGMIPYTIGHKIKILKKKVFLL